MSAPPWLGGGTSKPLHVLADARHWPLLASPLLYGGVHPYPAGRLVQTSRLCGEYLAEAPPGPRQQKEHTKEQPAAARDALTGTARHGLHLPTVSANPSSRESHPPHTGLRRESGLTALPPALGNPRGFGALRGGRGARAGAAFP